MGKPSPLADLEAFAAAHPPSRPGVKGFMRSLPADVLSACEQAYKRGHGAGVIVSWLRSIGYAEASRNKVGRYLSDLRCDAK